MEKIDILKSRLASFNQTLRDSKPRDPGGTYISDHLAAHFNKILTEFIGVFPDKKDLFPSEISLTHKLGPHTINRPSATYFDLQTSVNELIGIIKLSESE